MVVLRCLGSSGDVLGATWSGLGLSWMPLGASGEGLGGFLWTLWRVLGGSWGDLDLGAVLGPLWAVCKLCCRELIFKQNQDRFYGGLKVPKGSQKGTKMDPKRIQERNPKWTLEDTHIAVLRCGPGPALARGGWREAPGRGLWAFWAKPRLSIRILGPYWSHLGSIFWILFGAHVGSHLGPILGAIWGS